MAVITLPTGGEGNPLTLSDVYGLADKVIMEYLTGADIKNQYPELEKTLSEYGAISGYGRLAAQESAAVNPNTTTKSAPHYPDFTTEYFRERTEKRYWVDYRPQDAQKVLDGTMTMDAFVAVVVNSIMEGYKNETNKAIKNALGYQESTGTETDKAMLVLNADGTVDVTAKSILGNLGQYEEIADPTFEKVFNRLSIIAKKFTKSNNDFSAGFECGANLEDVAIYLPVDFTGAAGFSFLAKWNNQGEANKLPTIYETDGLMFDHDGVDRAVALIIDKRAISHVETYREVVDYMDVDRGHARGVSMVIEDMIPLAKYWKAYAIIFDMPTAAEEAVIV